MQLRDLVPSAEIASSLGQFSWAERLHSSSVENDREVIRFYSDGLNLQHKTLIEAFLKEALAGKELVVYFEKKDKTVSSKPASEPERKGAAAAPPRAVSARRAIPGVKRIIAVASGKGGVGKSTVSVNLAVSLHQQGYRVGILDADIYGPSLPLMLGIRSHPEVNEDNKIIPPEAHGLKVMSFGFFASEESAVIWRGPMVMKALQQFFFDVEWGQLDFLIIDLPPGTGDAQLTLVQSIPISGAVIVTTPQNVALLDAIKAIIMFEKTQIPVLGVIENMASFECPHCHQVSEIFGTGGGEFVEKKYHIPLLGRVPLLPEIRASGDEGSPLSAQKASHHIKDIFLDVAEKVVHRVLSVESSAADIVS